MPDFPSHITEIDPNLPQTALLCGRFNLANFTPDRFAALQIACPDSLKPAADKRKAEFLAGRAMAKRALQSLNQPPADIPIGPTRAPIWPRGIAGSISHARGHCAAIITTRPNTDLGVDIEAIATGTALKAIREKALTSPEHALLTGQPDSLATLIFSAKETLFKALYPTVQSHFGFDAARLMQLPSNGNARLILTRTLHASLTEGAVFDVHFHTADDHVLSWLAVHSNR